MTDIQRTSTQRTEVAPTEPVVPFDSGPVYCRQCQTPLTAADSFCPKCGAQRSAIVQDTVVTRDEIIDDGAVLVDDTAWWSSPGAWFLGLAALVLVIALVVVMATRDDSVNDTPTTTTLTTLTPTSVVVVPQNAPPAPIITPAPAPAPVIINQQPQQPPATGAPQTTSAPQTTQTTTAP